MRFAKTIAATAAGALLVAIGIVFGQFIRLGRSARKKRGRPPETAS
jgi:hypothetical protein